MVRTYIVELNGEVMEYCRRLCDAKAYAASIGGEVLAIHGQYFGEGFHKYRIRFVNGVARKVAA